MQENYPVLISCKDLKAEYNKLRKIPITSSDFTLGRGLKNSVVIPFLSISRNHCSFKKTSGDEWVIEDFSAFGIEVNGNRIGKGTAKKLSHDDIIILDPSQEFVYKFIDPSNDVFEVPKKRMKLDESVLLNDVKNKFEASQNNEIQNIYEKLENAKQMQTNSIILKEQLESDMSRKLHQLESNFALQIENLKGEKDEVERQKTLLIVERDSKLAAIREDMEGKIAELMDQIQKLSETETELLKENNLLKDKLLQEREEFLAELNRESTSKQDMLAKLEGRIREQEEYQLKQKQELEEILQKETEKLRLAKEKELQDLEEQKQLRELELVEEMNSIKKNLKEQMEQTEQQRLKTEQQLNEQMEQMKKLNDEDKVKLEHLLKEREEIQKRLTEAQIDAQKKNEALEIKVQEREIELAALAAERIQKQADQSSEVISSLQNQLERVRSQLQVVECEKLSLLESRSAAAPSNEGSSSHTAPSDEAGCSKQAQYEFGEVVDSELQCSICGELFVTPITLNCSHTFCQYCIGMWKKKKKDCPICRAPIVTECKSLVLDSFIERVMKTFSEDVRTKRQELLTSREELVAEFSRQGAADASRRSRGYDDSSGDDYGSEEGEGEDLDSEEREGYDFDGYGSYDDFGDDYYSNDDSFHWPWNRGRSLSDSDSGSDESDGDIPEGAVRAGAAGGGTVAAAAGAATGAGADTSTVTPTNNPAPGTDGNVATRGRRRRGRVTGLPGAYYGGYGRCYSCGARGHWAPGCPFRSSAAAATTTTTTAARPHRDTVTN